MAGHVPPFRQPHFRGTAGGSLGCGCPFICCMRLDHCNNRRCCLECALIQRRRLFDCSAPEVLASNWRVDCGIVRPCCWPAGALLRSMLAFLWGAVRGGVTGRFPNLSLSSLLPLADFDVQVQRGQVLERDTVAMLGTGPLFCRHNCPRSATGILALLHRSVCGLL
jgi:hypothetical protein